MRERSSCLAAAASLLTILLATPAAHAQTSYPLICKPGGGMVALVAAGAHVRVQFSAGTDAASTTPPSPGQCSWLDRGFRPGEPTVLTVSDRLADAKYLVESVLNGDTFYAHVTNNQQGAMVVTRVGP